MKKQTSIYKSVAEFAKAQPNAYRYAIRNNLLEKLCEKHGWKLPKAQNSYTLKECKKIALKYKTKKEWREKSQKSHNAASRHNWLKDCCNHMVEYRKSNGYWNLKHCIKAALDCKTINEFMKKYSSGYQTARKNNWLEDCCNHMIIKRNKWSKLKCKKEALKYNTRTEWKLEQNGSYTYALKNNWMNECCKHMGKPRKSKNFWSFKNCKQDALKYNTRIEWVKKSSSAYSIAYKNKWLNECCKHMISGNKLRYSKNK